VVDYLEYFSYMK